MLSPSPKTRILSVLEKNLMKNNNWTFAAVRYFTWKLEFISNFLWMILTGNCFLLLTCPRSPSNFIYLIIFINLRPLTQFQLNIKTNKTLKFVLLENYFPDCFSEVQIWYWMPFRFGLGRFSRKVKWIPAKIWLL